MLSFWEREYFLHYDYIIIGSGIVGLTTAIELSKRQPKARIVIIERGILPTGASTRNAGFACFGSLSEICTDIDSIGSERSCKLVEARWQGLKELRSLLGDSAISFENLGGYELIAEKQLHYLDRLKEVNELLANIFPKPVFSEENNKITDFGFNSKIVKKLLFNPFEGQLNVGKMMRSLLELAASSGVQILNGAEALEIEENSSSVKVLLNRKITGEKIELSATKVAICTNAFTKRFLPDEKIQPGRGQVLVTKPIPKLLFQGTFHFLDGYYYFRNIGSRILFGGGRESAPIKSKTTELGMNDSVISSLQDRLQKTILPNTPHEIEMEWSGIMAFGDSKEPIVCRTTERIAVGARLGGMGIALGAGVGKNVAKLLVE